MKLDDMMRALPPTLSVAEVSELTRFSGSAVYSACADGRLRSIRLGRRVRVLTESVLDLIDDEPALLSELRRMFVVGDECEVRA